MMSAISLPIPPQNLSREINILSEPSSDRSSKKSALEKILKQLTQASTTGLENETAAADFKNLCMLITKSLIKTLVDPIEKCREISIKILEIMVMNVEDLYQFLPSLMPFYTVRLAQITVVEPSEEIRLQMMKILNQLVLKTSESFTPFVEDTVHVLTRTCQDSFQDIRKESFSVIINLCKTVKRALALHGGAITKMILQSLNHRHSSVRANAIEALSAAMIVDASAIDDSIEPLRSMTRDKTPAVRERVFTLARDWLTQLMDRHIYGLKIIPFLYAGVYDELPKLSKLCLTYLDEVGAQYEKENNDRIKDELDYSDGVNRPGIVYGLFDDLFLDRPRSGCRHLARDNTQKIIAKQIELLGDWNLETRYQAAKVLTVFMEHTEKNATGYISVMLPAIYKVLAGDELQVMEQTIKIMEKVGNFVNLDTSLSLLLPAITGNIDSASSFRIGCLRSLQGLLRGSSPIALEPHLDKIISNLSNKDLMQNESIPTIIELAKCFGEIGKKLTTDSSALFHYFFTLVQLESFPGDPKVIGWKKLQESVQSALHDHARYLKTSLESLYVSHFDQGIRNVTENYSTWTQYSYEPRVLESFLFKSGKKPGESLASFIPVLVECAHSSKDFELRERALKIFLNMFTGSFFEKSQLNPWIPAILKDIILGCCIWRAGTKPAILRSHATGLLSTLLNFYSSLETVSWIEPLFVSDILPTICSNLDDDNQTTRQNCLTVLLYLLEVPGIWHADCFKKLYPELLKRMDDAKDEVRIQTAEVWSRFFPAVKNWMDSLANIKAELGPEDEGKLTIVKDNIVIELGLDRVHYETIIDRLLIHMDDTDHTIQESVCNALLEGKKYIFEPLLLQDKITSALPKHRSSLYLKKLSS